MTDAATLPVASRLSLRRLLRLADTPWLILPLYLLFSLAEISTSTMLRIVEPEREVMAAMLIAWSAARFRSRAIAPSLVLAGLIAVPFGVTNISVGYGVVAALPALLCVLRFSLGPGEMLRRLAAASVSRADWLLLAALVATDLGFNVSDQFVLGWNGMLSLTFAILSLALALQRRLWRQIPLYALPYLLSHLEQSDSIFRGTPLYASIGYPAGMCAGYFLILALVTSILRNRLPTVGILLTLIVVLGAGFLHVGNGNLLSMLIGSTLDSFPVFNSFSRWSGPLFYGPLASLLLLASGFLLALRQRVAVGCAAVVAGQVAASAGIAWMQLNGGIDFDVGFGISLTSDSGSQSASLSIGDVLLSGFGTASAVAVFLFGAVAARWLAGAPLTSLRSLLATASEPPGQDTIVLRRLAATLRNLGEGVRQDREPLPFGPTLFGRGWCRGILAIGALSVILECVIIGHGVVATLYPTAVSPVQSEPTKLPPQQDAAPVPAQQEPSVPQIPTAVPTPPPPDSQNPKK